MLAFMVQAFVQRGFPCVTLLFLIHGNEASETLCASDMVSSCEAYVTQGGCREDGNTNLQPCTGFPNPPTCFIRDSGSGTTYNCNTIFDGDGAFCRRDAQCMVYSPPPPPPPPSPPPPPPSPPSPPPLPSPPPSVNFFNTEAGVAVLGSVVSAVVLSFLIYIQRRVNARDVIAV